jgi:glucose-6-phosphate 1-dehydrogenase
MAKISYLPGDFKQKNQSVKLFNQLKNTLVDQGSDNLLFYLATYPNLYEVIFQALNQNGLNSKQNGWVRLIIEKPIGTDLTSAKKLNQLLHRYFKEEQIFRLDHYLGKETLQNMLIFRFNNGIFEHLMNNRHVAQIQITAVEEFGVRKRGGYYDQMGALRDVGQNHLLQMLALATMSAPKEFSSKAVTRERVKILQKLKPMPKKTVFGQYNGYLYEENVSPKSQADTFFALKTEIDNNRWKGVPIYMRAGKKLAKWATEIKIVFKVHEDRLFSKLDLGDQPNVLTYRVQPNEGISLQVLVKKPGHRMILNSFPMNFSYPKENMSLPDAYERLLYDAFVGDHTFFNDSQEVEEGWRFVDALLKKKGKPIIYDPGTWGPVEAEKIVTDDGNHWLEPTL